MYAVLFVFLSLVPSKGIATNILEQISEKVHSAKENGGVCSVDIRRNLIIADGEITNGSLPSYSKAVFRNGITNYNHITETLMCSNGLWVTLSNLDNQITENHHLRYKRACWPFLPLFFLFPPAGLIYASIFCPGESSSPPPPEPNRPPTVTCPTVPTTVYAPMLKRSAVVKWNEPTGSDPEGARVSISLADGQVSGSDFAHGSHGITYTGTDDVGNTGSCSIRFEVKVQYCFEDLYIENGRVVCNTSDNVFGTNCTIQCNAGHELKDNTTELISCQRIPSYNRQARSISPVTFNPLWIPEYSTNSKVNWLPPPENITGACQKMVCPEPQAPCNGHLVCSNNNSYEFGSTCYAVCREGYDSDQSQSLTCNGTHWLGYVQPCRDVEPPVAANCQKTIKKFADRAKTTTSVSWQKPTFFDNSDNSETCGTESSVNVSLIVGRESNSEFEIGFHEVSYAAIDGTRNAGYCNISIIVEELSCDPLVLNDTYVLQRCPDGYSYGSVCYFNCTLGYQLVGDSTITCEKNETTPDRGYWPWSNNTQVYCKKLRCPDLPVPWGGALSCSEALGNQICVMSCSDRYQVAKGTPFQYVCGEEQEWIPGLPPNCTDRVHPRNAILPGELFYYYSGDCSNATVQESIKNNFVDVMHDLENQGWDNICPSYYTVDGVTVKCGPLNGRRKRALADVGAGEMSQIEVNFVLNMTYLPNSSFIENDNLVNKLGDVVKMKAQKGAFDVDGMFSPTVAFGWSDFGCEADGLVPDYNEGTCVGCAPGNYLKGDECLECEKGTYQDQEYQVTCNYCLTGYSTEGKGATSVSDCKEQCNPGTFSRSGVKPCSPCPFGQFQPGQGKTKCIHCYNNTYTESTGSTNCSGTLKPKDGCRFRRKEWIHQARTYYSHTWEFYSRIFCETHQQYQHDESFSVESDFRHQYTPKCKICKKWNQISLTRNDRQGSVKLYINGDEKAVYNTRDLYLPVWSYLKINTDDIGSRLSGLFLKDNEMSKEEVKAVANTCYSEPQQKLRGIWYNMSKVYESEHNGVQFSPTLCDAIDECLSNPCGHGNVCHNNLGGYTCTCLRGYSGVICEIPPNFCIEHLCENGASCLSHFSNYSCVCATGFTGQLCEVGIVNGNWGSWLPWSDCSVSCNGGVQYRARLCMDPPPDPYGRDCVGANATEQTCSNQPCPVCPHYMSIYSFKNRFNCSSENDTIYCNVTCQEGYAFVDSFYPIDYYECGPGTNHMWNASPPRCCRLSNPRRLRATIRVPYDNVDAGSENQLQQSVQDNMNALQCVQNHTCSYTTAVLDTTGSRIRRSITAEVVLILTSNLTEDDLRLEDLYANNVISQALADLVNKVIDMSMSAAQLNTTSELWTVNINNSTYSPNMELLTMTGEVSCQPGKVIKDSFLCAECPSGTYWENDTCKLCPKGSYQDQTAQLSCIECPLGLTTLYKASNSSSLCVEDNTYIATSTSLTESTTSTTTQNKETTEDDPKTEIIVIAVCVPVVMVLIVVLFVFLWKYREHLRQISRKRAFGSITSLDMVHPELTIYVRKSTPPVKRLFKHPPEEEFTTDFHHSHH